MSVSIARPFVVLQGTPSVAGPSGGTSTDNALVRWDGTNARTVQNSNATLSDLGALVLALGATLGGVYVGSTDTRSGPGAVSVTKETTKVTTTGVSDALTLADGVDGQIKRIVHDVDGGSFVLTPATKTGWSTFTSTAVGESVSLVFVTTRGWMVVGSYLGAIA